MSCDGYHKPVLLTEVLEYMNIYKDGIYFDGTLGGGGYSEAILDKLSEKGLLISTDLDDDSIDYCNIKFAHKENIRIIKANYTDITKILHSLKIVKIDGAVLDLGVSSHQLDDSRAGFSYRQDSVLDLRFDKSTGYPAYKILMNEDEKKLSDIFWQFGEEKNHKRIAKEIVIKRTNTPLQNTSELVNLISKITPKNKINETLSRIFQALRIVNNNELENLKIFLQNVLKVCKTGTRIAIISYHSLEDKIVKDFINYEALACVCPKEIPVCICGKKVRVKKITKRIVIPSVDEIQENKRARSAKLRVMEVI